MPGRRIRLAVLLQVNRPFRDKIPQRFQLGRLTTAHFAPARPMQAFWHD
jgi:hypothetical protein